MVRLVCKHYGLYYNDMNIKFIIARMFYNVTNDDILDLELYLDKYILFFTESQIILDNLLFYDELDISHQL